MRLTCCCCLPLPLPQGEGMPLNNLPKRPPCWVISSALEAALTVVCLACWLGELDAASNQQRIDNMVYNIDVDSGSNQIKGRSRFSLLNHLSAYANNAHSKPIARGLHWHFRLVQKLVNCKHCVVELFHWKLIVRFCTIAGRDWAEPFCKVMEIQ